MSATGLLSRYRRAAVEVAIVIRVNVWEDVPFEHITPQVRAALNKIEAAIQTARNATISVLASDKEVTDDMVSSVLRNTIMPRIRGHR